MRPRDFLKDLKYLGQAEGDRNTYDVFETRGHFLVAGPTDRGGYYLNIVEREAPDVVAEVFKGRKVTSGTVKKSARRPDLFPNPPAALNTLYVMVALGVARKLKQHDGRAMVFRIR
jgi:hypothetical protein